MDRLFCLLEFFRKMPTDGFTFAIRIRCKIGIINLTRLALECRYDLPFPPNQDILGSKGILNINAKLLLWKVPDMSNGGFNNVIST